MSIDNDEFSRRIQATLDRSVEQLDEATAAELQQARTSALSAASTQRNYRPAMMIAASLVALILAPWLVLKQPDPALPGMAQWDDSGYLVEDPDMLADWEMLDALGEVPDVGA